MLLWPSGHEHGQREAFPKSERLCCTGTRSCWGWRADKLGQLMLVDIDHQTGRHFRPSAITVLSLLLARRIAF